MIQLGSRTGPCSTGQSGVHLQTPASSAGARKGKATVKQDRGEGGLQLRKSFKGQVGEGGMPVKVASKRGLGLGKCLGPVCEGERPGWTRDVSSQQSAVSNRPPDFQTVC